MADGALSKVFSASEGLRRRVKDFARNPLDYAQQTADYVKNQLTDPEKTSQMITENMNPASGISGGALGMLIGMRGAKNLGSSRISDQLEQEFLEAAKRKRGGEEFRMRANSAQPLVHTGFEGRPFREIDDTGLYSYKNQEFDVDIPILNQWRIQDDFTNAYRDGLGELKLLNSTKEPTGRGSYDPNENLITLGYGPHSNKDYEAKMQQYPALRKDLIKNTMAHELGGHFMQNMERVTGGTDPAYMIPWMKNNIQPQVEKSMAEAQFLEAIGRGMNPMDAYQEQASVGVSEGALRKLATYMKNLKTGQMTREDAANMVPIRIDAVRNLSSRQDKHETVQNLINKGLMDRVTPEIRASSKLYADNNFAPNTTPLERMQSYGLYRTNVGENQAEAIGMRTHLSPKERMAEPFYNQTEVPLDLLHTVR